MPEKPAEEGKYKGQKISLDFQDADIGPIFRLLADISGYNFVIDPAVKGKITLKLMNVPWEQALDIILQTFGLGKSIEGNIVWIAPITTFTKISEDKAKAKASEEIAEELVQEVIRINYATSCDISGAIDKGKLLSSRGSITPDPRMNTLIIKDTQKNINKIKELVKIMDVTKPQVMIEAKMVEVSSTYTEELGIRWGGTIGTPPAGIGIGEIKGGTFAVNTPLSPVTGPGGVLGLSLGSATTVKVDLTLSALETVGKSRNLSNPKIMTMDNESATISQGTKIPYQTTSAEGTKTEFADATLSLTVTPKITPDGYVQLKITATNDSPGPLTPEGREINKQKVDTQTLVKNGETLVIGGIYITNTTESEGGIPLLSRIPILGWLFKTKKWTGPDVTELLIFITPTIVTKP
ncbi:MAG: type IV pilus secretin PilQ [Nitrospirae bacterium]|nr:type IV pilus secretin PilQ [Nitrospirota bacterium]